jgi:hypothetical protein
VLTVSLIQASKASKSFFIIMSTEVRNSHGRGGGRGDGHGHGGRYVEDDHYECEFLSKKLGLRVGY